MSWRLPTETYAMRIQKGIQELSKALGTRIIRRSYASSNLQIVLQHCACDKIPPPTLPVIEGHNCSWDVKVIDHDPDGSCHERFGEVHFGWVLEGRAIQDVWIVPRRGAGHGPNVSTIGNRYGATLRVYDPNINAWHIIWMNPVTQTYNTMLGHKVKDEIVQEYRDEDGTLNQWVFSEITSNSSIGLSVHRMMWERLGMSRLSLSHDAKEVQISFD
jgi:hypothetical protein